MYEYLVCTSVYHVCGSNLYVPLDTVQLYTCDDGSTLGCCTMALSLQPGSRRPPRGTDLYGIKMQSRPCGGGRDGRTMLLPTMTLAPYAYIPVACGGLFLQQSSPPDPLARAAPLSLPPLRGPRMPPYENIQAGPPQCGGDCGPR